MVGDIIRDYYPTLCSAESTVVVDVRLVSHTVILYRITGHFNLVKIAKLKFSGGRNVIAVVATPETPNYKTPSQFNGSFAKYNTCPIFQL